MKVLTHDWPSFTGDIIKKIFRKRHIQVDSFYYYPLASLEDDDVFVKKFSEKIRSGSYDFVFGVNYIPVVAIACYKENIPYVSWSYDAPLNLSYETDTLYYPTNYVFLFDRAQANGYISQGFDRVWHLPLAIDTDHYDMFKPSNADYKRFKSQISFVGQIYNSTYPKIIPPLGEFERKYLDSLINVQTDLYGAFVIDEYLNDDIINKVNTCYREKLIDKTFQVSKKQLSYSLSTYVTFKERVTILSLLSKKFDVALYSGDEHPLLTETKQKGRVDYSTEMPYVFKCSDINLNITLKCLQTGIPLRALDIMGCGGFLLTNYQEEFLDYLVPNEDFVYYEDFGDSYEKAAFYMQNEDIRKKIAQNGYNKIKQRFSYDERLDFIADKCPFMK